MKNKVSIITLTYNNLEKATKPFIEYLYKNGENFELIIVDNGSTDGTVDYLRGLERKFNNLKVIYNSENLGFSKGCNQGIQLVQGDIIGFLNNDILFSSDWIKPILEVIEKEENAGFISPCSVEASYYSRKKFDKKVKKSQKQICYDLCINPDFSCVFVKKQVLDKIGLFDENFSPAYFEDDDLAWRAILGGFRNFKLNSVYFYHLGSLTGKSLIDLHEIFQRNNKYFFQKYSDKPFVECYWKEANKYISLKNKILSYRCLFSLIGMKKLWKNL